MKKTLIVIVAVILIVVLSLTLFSCKKSKKTEEPVEEDVVGKEISASELGTDKAITDQVINYASQYITNNATDSKDVSSAMGKALTQQFVVKNGPIKAVNVTYVKGSGQIEDHYKIKITYSKTNNYYNYDGSTDLVARTAVKGVQAGYTAGGTAIAASKNDEELGKAYNALIHTIKAAVEDATAFGKDYEKAAVADYEAKKAAEQNNESNGDQTNNAIAGAGDAATGVKFGGSVEGLFFLNYGTGEDQIGPMSYGLKVYGTLGYAAEDTEVAIEIIDEYNNKTLGGLYYKNNTLYLMLDFEYEVNKRNADGKLVDASGAVIEDEKGNLIKGKTPVKIKKQCQEKLKLSQATLNEIFGGMLGESFSKDECVNLATGASQAQHTDESGVCTFCGAKKPAAPATHFYEKPDTDKLSNAIGSLIGGDDSSGGMVGTIVSMVLGLLKGTTATVDGATRYVFTLDVGSLLTQVKKTFGTDIDKALSKMINEMGITFLKDFSLGTFAGVGGVLSLAFDVKNPGTTDSRLTGAQIAYNVAQQDFRWSADDAKAKIYGPVNAAITIKGFKTSTTEKVSIGINDADYADFSPLNVEATADLTLSGYSDAKYNKTYAVVARAAYNPFAISEGKSEIILTNKANNEKFLHVYFHKVDEDIHVTTYLDANFDGTANGTYYDTKADDSKLGTLLYENFMKPLVEEGSISDISPISDYVWALIHQFEKKETVADVKAELEKAAADAIIDIQGDPNDSTKNGLQAKKAVRETVKKDGKDVTQIKRDANGKIVYEILTDSTWMAAIKTNAVNAITAIKNGIDADLADIDAAIDADEGIDAEDKAAAKEDAKIKKLKELKKDVADKLSKAKKDYNAQVKKEGKNESIFTDLNVMGLVSAIGDIKDLFVGKDNKPVDTSVLNYNFTKPVKESDPDIFVTANLNSTTYNKVILALKDAMPLLNTFDSTAAEVTVHMNDSTDNKNKLLVNVKYPGGKNPKYVIDVALDSGDCLGSVEKQKEDGSEYTEYFLKSTCKLSADVKLTLDGKTYVYKAVLDIKGWDTNNGTIDVTFYENDGTSSSITADQKFVDLHIVQKWEKEGDKDAYRGFTATATLQARKKDSHDLYDNAFVYNVSALYDATSKMFNLTLDTGNGNTITLGIGDFNGRLDRDNLLTFGIPTPVGGCTLKVTMGDEKNVTFKFENAKISKWGKGVVIEGNTFFANQTFVTGGQLDNDFYDYITGLLDSFFYKTQQQQQE